MADVLIPSALAYAGIVGVAVTTGLYTVPLALVAYAICGGSRLLVVGPDVAISMLAATTIAGVAGGDTPDTCGRIRSDHQIACCVRRSKR